MKKTAIKNCSIYKELFKHMSDAVVVYQAVNNGKDFIIADCNHASLKIEGLKKKDIVGKKVTEAFPGVKQFGLFDIFQKVYRTGKPSHHPIKYYSDNRISGWRKNYVYKVSTGEIVAVYQDITQQKKDESELKKRANELSRTLVDTIHAFGLAIEKRDKFTSGHQKRVAKLARCIAKKMNLPKEKTEAIYLGALVHDVGKLSVPRSILNFPGKLNKKEFALVQLHPQTGHDIIKEIKFPSELEKIILSHHERLDGSGYPQGLKGNEIPIESRIIAVADVAEAMTANRPYRQGHQSSAIIKELQKNKNTLFDANVVDACVEILKSKKNKINL
jgi:putative nucleotidyltransferase with HDIG domain